MTATNEPYVASAWAGALAGFEAQAGPGNVNDNLFALACRLLELAHAAPGVYSEADAERVAGDAARRLGHDDSSINATWRSAQRTVAGKAAVIPAPAYANGNGTHAPAGFADLAAYAASRGVPVAAFQNAGWSDSELWEFSYTDKHGKPALGLTDQERLVYTRTRRALRFASDAGPRYRLIDEPKPSPKYWHPYGTHLDSNKAWYRLPEALALAVQADYLALVNGEAGVVCGQYAGVPALCETGGGEKTIPPQLLQLLKAVWPVDRPIVVALDCDGKGRSAAIKKAQQLRDAGYATVRAIDLSLGNGGEDIADLCQLHGPDSPTRLLRCPDLPAPASPNGQTPAAPVTGSLKPSEAAIQQLTRLGYTFRTNLCGNLIEVNGKPIDDGIAAEIRTALRDEGIKRFGLYEDAWTTHANANAYHPVRDYLESLVWDGTKRIMQLATYFHGPHPIVTYQDGNTCPLNSVYLHRWFIGAAAKALHSEQNAMLVFAGPQGLGKSHFAHWVCPPELRDRYYLEADINIRDKDSQLRLLQMFIWEVGELDRTTRKQDVADLKQFISEKSVTVRRSYGRYDTRGPALASLIGTVNGTEFLADDTGNRRFFVIELERLDWAYQQLPIDQIWAEAVARLRAGEPWRLTPDEAHVQTQHNREYLADSLTGDYIRRYFFVTGDPSHTMTAAEIIDTLLARQVRLPQNDRSLSMDISRAMAALGVKKERNRNARYYVGICPK